MDVVVAVFPRLHRGSPKQTYVIFTHFTPLYATFLHFYYDLKHFKPLFSGVSFNVAGLDQLSFLCALAKNQT
jgi:hypothetical protein